MTQSAIQEMLAAIDEIIAGRLDRPDRSQVIRGTGRRGPPSPQQAALVFRRDAETAPRLPHAATARLPPAAAHQPRFPRTGQHAMLAATFGDQIDPQSATLPIDLFNPLVSSFAASRRFQVLGYSVPGTRTPASLIAKARVQLVLQVVRKDALAAVTLLQPRQKLPRLLSLGGAGQDGRLSNPRPRCRRTLLQPGESFSQDLSHRSGDGSRSRCLGWRSA
jgi:hypothetical protein